MGLIHRQLLLTAEPFPDGLFFVSFLRAFFPLRKVGPLPTEFRPFLASLTVYVRFFQTGDPFPPKTEVSLLWTSDRLLPP